MGPFGGRKHEGGQTQHSETKPSTARAQVKTRKGTQAHRVGEHAPHGGRAVRGRPQRQRDAVGQPAARAKAASWLMLLPLLLLPLLPLLLLFLLPLPPRCVANAARRQRHQQQQQRPRHERARRRVAGGEAEGVVQVARARARERGLERRHKGRVVAADGAGRRLVRRPRRQQRRRRAPRRRQQRDCTSGEPGGERGVDARVAEGAVGGRGAPRWRRRRDDGGVRGAVQG